MQSTILEHKTIKKKIMKATKETHRTLTAKIKALNEYLNSECTAYYFLYNWAAKDRLTELIDILEIKLTTLIYLNQFDITVQLSEYQRKTIDLAISKEYITETYLTI